MAERSEAACSEQVASAKQHVARCMQQQQRDAASAARTARQRRSANNAPNTRAGYGDSGTNRQRRTMGQAGQPTKRRPRHWTRSGWRRIRHMCCAPAARTMWSRACAAATRHKHDTNNCRPCGKFAVGNSLCYYHAPLLKGACLTFLAAPAQLNCLLQFPFWISIAFYCKCMRSCQRSTLLCSALFCFVLFCLPHRVCLPCCCSSWCNNNYSNRSYTNANKLGKFSCHLALCRVSCPDIAKNRKKARAVVVLPPPPSPSPSHAISLCTTRFVSSVINSVPFLLLLWGMCM